MESNKKNAAPNSQGNEESPANSKPSLKDAAKDLKPQTIHGPGGVPLSNPPRPFSHGGSANSHFMKLPEHIDIVKPKEENKH
ncbi:uncharacterized protein SOCG_00614 [Schizosaccharomyces octosporus yFS286]|uniref:Uncharacterized protein n=1 Tax=Schizosaccharomyces octosporus (strain yFS286) TaxID=483514 RepID=S9PY04_SCHOY|nr:uncharacterized protein SOCG_00614 [Schizosaccharomyces octosporus yFS286]EPX72852.1 hypothetical protein SOCG_00614 [Schizosaccharomyces octosporus yFS286]